MFTLIINSFCIVTVSKCLSRPPVVALNVGTLYKHHKKGQVQSYKIYWFQIIVLIFCYIFFGYFFSQGYYLIMWINWYFVFIDAPFVKRYDAYFYNKKCTDKASINDWSTYQSCCWCCTRFIEIVSVLKHQIYIWYRHGQVLCPCIPIGGISYWVSVIIITSVVTMVIITFKCRC